MWFWIGTGKIKLVHEIDLVCDYLKNTKRKLFTNLESPELSLYAFKPVCRTILETLWGKFQNLLGIKLTAGVTLLLLSVVMIFVSYHMCWLWNQLNQRTFVILVIELPVQLNGILKKFSWKIMVLLAREGTITATIFPLWEILGLMLRKVGIIKFSNPSWIHQNYFWNSLRQTLKFICNEVGNWCNFTASFSSR